MHGKDYSHVRAGYRRAAVQAHYIFYKTNGPQIPIEIIRVLHKNMDVMSKLKS
jgi:toxin ParE1/3/4